MSTRAVLVAIGDELLEGRYADQNSSELARELAGLGVEVERVLVLRDDAPALARAFAELLDARRLVIASGGLGPTLDDVTREAAAAAAGVPLLEDAEAAARLRAWFAQRGAPMPELNLRQAQLPQGAQLLPNSCGTAPGFLLAARGGWIAALPGPPHEMRAMWAEQLRPRLAGLRELGEPLASARFHLLGVSESGLAEQLGDEMRRPQNPLVGITASDGRLTVVYTQRAEPGERATQADLEARLAPRAARFRERFAARIYSQSEARLEFVLGQRLIEQQISVATAESCTGGLLAGALTRVPGISAVLAQGWIVYSNTAKQRELGVPAELLARHGAVSLEVARALAEGAARRAGARLALAITGVAGPSGGTAEKPVGLVCFGVCFDGRSSAEERRFPPVDRERIRAFAVNTALFLGLRALEGAGARA